MFISSFQNVEAKDVDSMTHIPVTVKTQNDAAPQKFWVSVVRFPNNRFVQRAFRTNSVNDISGYHRRMWQENHGHVRIRHQRAQLGRIIRRADIGRAADDIRMPAANPQPSDAAGVVKAMPRGVRCVLNRKGLQKLTLFHCSNRHILSLPLNN
jgi:hypothetical protein